MGLIVARQGPLQVTLHEPVVDTITLTTLSSHYPTGYTRTLQRTAQQTTHCSWPSPCITSAVHNPRPCWTPPGSYGASPSERGTIATCHTMRQTNSQQGALHKPQCRSVRRHAWGPSRGGDPKKQSCGWVLNARLPLPARMHCNNSTPQVSRGGQHQHSHGHCCSTAKHKRHHCCCQQSRGHCCRHSRCSRTQHLTSGSK